MADYVTVTLECAKCRRANILEPAHPAEGKWIKCASCGERLITLDRFTDLIGEEALRLFRKGARDAATGR